MAKLVYFLQEDKAGGPLPCLVYDSTLNAVIALARKDGIFSTQIEIVADLLRHLGYREVSKRQMKALRLLPAPAPDMVDWEIEPHHV